ncbi:class I SAM-dependent methyltransferase [Candidatus Roizmanbacteria bacterium]|nr:class I SAM-dependent methyltransferase [Candidatus Roizmanbacteria bacterium]
MKQPHIYTDKSSYYDLVYKWKNYRAETSTLIKLINRYKKSFGINLLDVACGTGEHLRYLRSIYNCEGLDISQNQLTIASEKLPDITFHTGDMIDFNLEKKFDVIICLFSAISYVRTITRLKKTLTNFYHHLKKGGVLIIEPWFDKGSKDFKIDIPYMTTYEDNSIKITRISIAKIQGNLSIMDTRYLIGEKNKGIYYFSEKHILGLFKKKEFLKLLKKTGFRSEFLSRGLINEDRGLYIGLKN